jgi:hypothetical protein
MRPLLGRFSEPVGSAHTPSWVDFITIMPVFKFSVHTAIGLFGGPFRFNGGSEIADLPQQLRIDLHQLWTFDHQ